MSVRFFSLLLVSPLVVVVAHAGAQADCAAGAGYQASAANNSVTITPTGSSRACPDSSGMLRQDETTGQVERLADFCNQGAYVDECVPAGSYRYGYATPFDCSESGCGGVGLFAEVTVTTALPPACVRSTGDAGPTVVTTVPPWGVGGPDSGLVAYKDCPHGCSCGSVGVGRTRVLSVDVILGSIALAWMAVRRYRRRKS
jgi:hypothetical protein